MCQPIQVLPSQKTKKRNTSAYYQCLLNESLKGFTKPITQICRNCKANSSNLATQRNQEITALLTAYQQIGESLNKLLQSLND